MKIDTNQIFSICPTVMVPPDGVVSPLEKGTQRILMAGNGVWYEVSLAWVRVVTKLSDALPVHVPYGLCHEVFELHCGSIPVALLRRFIEDAKHVAPSETGAWIVWNSIDSSWRYEQFQVISASAEHLVYETPQLTVDEYCVLDIHSHGIDRAFFSPDDDEDDRTHFSISGVVGNVTEEEITSVFRLNLRSFKLPINFNL